VAQLVPPPPPQKKPENDGPRDGLDGPADGSPSSAWFPFLLFSALYLLINAHKMYRLAKRLGALRHG
jgi:hypothetical protein